MFNSPVSCLFYTFSDENLEIMNDYDCVGILLNALQTHIKEAKVVKNACMALAAMVEPNGMCFVIHFKL